MYANISPSGAASFNVFALSFSMLACVIFSMSSIEKPCCNNLSMVLKSEASSFTSSMFSMASFIKPGISFSSSGNLYIPLVPLFIILLSNAAAPLGASSFLIIISPGLTGPASLSIPIAIYVYYTPFLYECKGGSYAPFILSLISMTETKTFAGCTEVSIFNMSADSNTIGPLPAASTVFLVAKSLDVK